MSAKKCVVMLWKGKVFHVKMYLADHVNTLEVETSRYVRMDRVERFDLTWQFFIHNLEETPNKD